jgi:uncharacterized integral membrane protein
MRGLPPENSGAAVKPVELVTYFGGALAWPALYGVIFLAVVLGLLTAATGVALFARNEKRANRAFRIFRELLRLFCGRSR